MDTQHTRTRTHFFTGVVLMAITFLVLYFALVRMLVSVSCCLLGNLPDAEEELPSPHAWSCARGRA